MSCCSEVAIAFKADAAFCVSTAPLVVFWAAVATPVILRVISVVPLAASDTLRPISLVVAVCSSTAEAMVFETSLIWLIIELISPIANTAALLSP